MNRQERIENEKILIYCFDVDFMFVLDIEAKRIVYSGPVSDLLEILNNKMSNEPKGDSLEWLKRNQQFVSKL